MKKINLIPTVGLRAAKAVASDHGVSPISIWRWAREGRIRIVRIANRPFVDLGSLHDFHERALAGEFETELSGAARKSAAERQKKEGAT